MRMMQAYWNYVGCPKAPFGAVFATLSGKDRFDVMAGYCMLRLSADQDVILDYTMPINAWTPPPSYTPGGPVHTDEGPQEA